jgi:phosphatidylglycerophosphatase A
MSVNEIKAAGLVRGGVTFIATGLGLGYSPIASGTMGTAWGVLIVVGLSVLQLPWEVYVAICLGLTLMSFPICHVAESVFAKKDDGRIVADEYLTFPICMIGLVDHVATYWWLLPMAFLTSRFFDIVKLPPARQLERIPGGAGITLDDAAANLFSLAANWAVYSLVIMFFY